MKKIIYLLVLTVLATSCASETTNATETSAAAENSQGNSAADTSEQTQETEKVASQSPATDKVPEVITSGKVTVAMKYTNTEEDGEASITLVQQGDNASYLIKEDTEYLQPSEADPETSRQIDAELIRVGEDLFVSSKIQENKWIKIDESEFDYTDDDIFFAFRQDDNKFDLSEAVGLLKNGENFKQEQGSDKTEIYSASIDFEAVSFEEAMELPAGLDIIAADDNGVADIEVSARNQILEEITLAYTSVHPDFEPGEATLDVTITFSELGQPQEIIAPADDAILSSKEASEEIEECSDFCVLSSF